MGGNQPIHPQVSGSRKTPLEVTEKAGRGAFPLRAINHLRPACPGHARRRHRPPRPSNRRQAANRHREFGVRPAILDTADQSAADRAGSVAGRNADRTRRRRAWHRRDRGFLALFPRMRHLTLALITAAVIAPASASEHRACGHAGISASSSLPLDTSARVLATPGIMWSPLAAADPMLWRTCNGRRSPQRRQRDRWERKAAVDDMTLDLTDEEAAALRRLLNRAIEDDRYPLSLRIRTLRHIRAKLPGAPLEPPPARPPRTGRARR